jgi:dTDP-4-amino-4,6-dideoxygalactose transaminase
MGYQVPLFELNFDAAEEQAVMEVLRSKWISMGPKTAELEDTFARHLGVRHAVAVSNCTSALHLTLAALNIGPGDEVIVPSLTFVATVNCVGYVGAQPVFADITSHSDFGLDPAQARALITPRTKAIICMHYGGFACDMKELVQIAEEHHLALVEDAAHAPNACFDGRRVGGFGAAGCFSFYANKNISCGEGGLIAANSDELAGRLRLLRAHGMTSMSYDRARGHATEYDVVLRGYNFRMDDIRAALVLAQFQKLEADTARRDRLRRLYLEHLAGVPHLVLPYQRHRHASSHYILPVVLDGGGAACRNRVREFLAARGIQTSVHYPAVHRFSMYRSLKASLPKTDFVTDHQITLPLHGRLADETVALVCGTLAEAVATVFP